MTDPLGRQTTASVDPSTGNTTQTTDARTNSTTYSYDSVTGDLTSTTNPLGQSRYMGYDGFGDLTSVTDGFTTLWSAVYDSAMRKTSETDANGKTTSYVYDSLDRLTSSTRMVSGQAVTTSFQYDADSDRTQLTDPNTHTWTWAYDAMDRASQETNPLSQSVGFAYDLAGNLQTRTDRLGQKGVFTFDAANRISSKTFKRADGSTQSAVNYTYDPTTKLLTSVTDTGIGGSNNTTAWVYDSLDRVVTETRPDGSQLHSVLDDKVDRRLTLQFPNLSPNPGDISYSFDNNDNITAITRNGQTTSITYDALNRRTLQTLPSGVTTSWSYDSHGFVGLILSNNGNLDGHGYTRDAVGNITQEQVNGGTFTYGYDDLYRLTSASVLGTSYSWTYDKAGNRLTQVAGGVTTTSTYNAADRLATVNGATVTHDANGQVLADETGGAYTWDVRGRLTSLTRNGASASFLYDQDDLRISKTVGSTTTSYLLDGNEVVRETTGGTPTDLLQGPGTDNLLSRGGNWLLHNGLDSTAAVVNGSGSILQYYYYAPFGQATVQGGGSVQPYQFTGREADESGLMYYRARYYNPSWGRFVSEDPLGVAGAAEIALSASVADPTQTARGLEPGGFFGQGHSERVWLFGLRPVGPAWTIDPYVYAGDNPVNEADPSGRNIIRGGNFGSIHPYGPVQLGMVPLTPGDFGPVIGGRIVVIGETMGRVRAFARLTGARWYQAWGNADAEVLMARNARWIRNGMDQGWTIIDIGIDETRTWGRSVFYALEKSILDEAGYPYIPVDPWW